MKIASVVVVNWNGMDLLRKYLPSVIKAVQATGPEHELIVVDDASTDESLAVLREEFPFAKVVSLTKNSGFGTACAAGAEAAKGDIVVMLNSDMHVEMDFLINMLPVFDNPQVFAVSCQIRRWDGKSVEIGKTTGKFRLGFIKVLRNDESERIGNIPVPHFYASGGASGFDKKKFFQIGGFHPIYHPFYWEDTDLSYRARQRGWLVYYQPNSIVYHKHQGTIGKAFSKNYVRSISYRNRLILQWTCFTDMGMLLQHFALLIPYTLIMILIGRFYHGIALFYALKMWKCILQKRNSDKPFVVSQDAEIFDN